MKKFNSGYQSALQLIQNLEQEFLSDKEKVLLQQGLWLVRSGREDDAVVRFTEAINCRPGFARAYFQRAMSYLSLGRYEQALLDLDKVIDLDNEHLPSYLARAQARLGLKQYQECIKDCDLTISLVSWPTNLENNSESDTIGNATSQLRSMAHATSARAHFNLANYSAALVRCDRSIAIQPTAEAFRVRAAVNRRIGKINESRSDLVTSKNLLSTEENRVLPSPDAEFSTQTFVKKIEVKALRSFSTILTELSSSELFIKIIGFGLFAVVIFILWCLGIRREQ